MSCVHEPVGDCMHSERYVYAMYWSVGVGIAGCPNIGARNKFVVHVYMSVGLCMYVGVSKPIGFHA